MPFLKERADREAFSCLPVLQNAFLSPSVPPHVCRTNISVACVENKSFCECVVWKWRVKHRQEESDYFIQEISSSTHTAFQLHETVKFALETDNKKFCSDSAVSACRWTLPGDRSCRAARMIHGVQDCLLSQKMVLIYNLNIEVLMVH